VAAGEEVLHPLKKFYWFKKWCQKDEKNSQNLFLATKIFEIFFKILVSFLKIFHPCSTPSRAHEPPLGYIDY
jgi:hypothetical protein